MRTIFSGLGGVLFTFLVTLFGEGTAGTARGFPFRCLYGLDDNPDAGYRYEDSDYCVLYREVGVHNRLTFLVAALLRRFLL